MQNLQQHVNQAYEHAQQWLGQGKPASYIPELSKADPSHLAVAVTDLNGNTCAAGDSSVRFTIQSISKTVILITAIRLYGYENVFARVGMEPTGDPFYSIVRLETMQSRRPLNPMINAGAIAVTSCIPGATPDERFGHILESARLLFGNPELDYDRAVYLSESRTGDTNRAMAYMMRANGVIEGNVEEHLDTYFKACSILASCRQISRIAAVLANNGIDPDSGRRLVDPLSVKVVRSLMCTCGMYDESGRYAIHVGVPSKSVRGVSVIYYHRKITFRVHLLHSAPYSSDSCHSGANRPHIKTELTEHA
jgi:glutaminase